MQTLALDGTGLEQAAQIIRRGGLVAIPTETVYGLGADALNAEAVRHIFEAKGRPQDNPLIIHVPSADWLETYCHDIPDAAYALAAEFWPGPLTMILPRREIVPLQTTGGLETVGVRCPNHPLTLEIIARAGVPIAAPSGNTSGRPSPTTAAHMWEDMDGKIDAIVDGGPCGVGVESTIIDLTVTPPRLLRPGGLPLEELRRVLGEVAVDEAVVRKMADDEHPRAPGMKYRHYAPKAPVTVFTGAPAAAAAVMAARVGTQTGIICFDEFAGRFSGCEVQTLGPVGQPETHARRVFDALRHFDSTAVTEILAQCPPETGLGLAVANRLKKAAGFQTVAVPSGRPLWVLGITGGTGCGKTSLLRRVAARGGLCIDCDAVYHRLLREDAHLLEALRVRFPAAFAGGALDRKALGRLVFGNPAELAALNAITHPAVRAAVQQTLDAARADGVSLAAIDAVGLIEGGLRALCSRTVAVTAPEQARVQRLMAREGIGEDYARLRIAAQKPDAAFAAGCDDVLVNDCPDAAEFDRCCGEYLDRVTKDI